MRTGIKISDLHRAGVGARIGIARGTTTYSGTVPVKNVKEDWTASRRVPTQVTFDAPLHLVPTAPLDPLNNYGQKIHLFSQIKTSSALLESEIGWFQIDHWDEDADALSVTALDLLQVLAESDMTWPSSPPSGATLLSELQRLCSAGSSAGLSVVLEVPNRSIPRAFQWGTDRLEAIGDLCEAYGLTYGVKPDGAMHVWEIPTGRVPVAHYTGTDLLVDAPRTSTERIANVFTVVGGREDDPANRYSATVQNTSFPYDPAGYGIVTERTALDAATSTSQVLKAAQTRMRTALSVVETRSLEIAMDPRLEGMDVISCITGEGEALVGRVIAYSRTLDKPSEKMRVDVEVLKW
jgi:hypothetical protein